MAEKSWEELLEGVKKQIAIDHHTIVKYLIKNCKTEKELIDKMFEQANNGNLFAMKQIAEWYNDGIYIENDFSESIKWYSRIYKTFERRFTLEFMYEETYGDHNSSLYYSYYTSNPDSIGATDCLIFSDPVGTAASNLGDYYSKKNTEEDLKMALQYYNDALACRFSECQDKKELVEKKLKKKISNSDEFKKSQCGH